MSLKKFVVFLCWVCSCGNVSSAVCGDDTLRCRVYFPVGRSAVDFSYRNNGLRLDSLLSGVHFRRERAPLRRITLSSGASPEGNSTLNRRLSDGRLASLRSVIQERLSIPDSLFATSSLGEDWDGLAILVGESGTPYREEVLRILQDTPEWVTRNGVVVDSRKRQLMNLRGGRAWRHMVDNIFPELRNCSVVICEFGQASTDNEGEPDMFQEKVEPADAVIPCDTAETVCVACDSAPVSFPVSVASPPGTFRMALRSNLLYDVLLVPNIGLEFYLGGNWTVGGNWIYGWWDNDRRHRYWRIYGGDLSVRRYFGARSKEHPMSGHHLGVYGQIFTYDFERGGRGYMGGKPGGTLWDRMNYTAGLEYGYSLPIARRLNIDFSMAVGYWGGIYHEYLPEAGYYLWKQTSRRSWIGPTKAEISLVWLLGRGNQHGKKGDKR